MSSFRFLCVLVGPHVSLWVLIGFYLFVFVFAGPYWSLCVFMQIYGF